MSDVTFVVVLALLVAVALAGAWFGADTRPGAGQPPEPQWPFYRHRG